MGELDDLAAAVDRDPRAVAERATRLAAEYRVAAADEPLAQALILVGRAQRLLGEIDVASAALREAVAASSRAGDDELRADAHLQLAAVLSFAGDAAEAGEHLFATTEAIGSPRLQARATLQRAAIAQRIGHVVEALGLYAVALPQLRAEGAAIDVARVLANRGVIRVGTGDPDLAVADFTEAATRFQEGGQEFAAIQVLNNLGWAAARAGDIPRALAALDEAEAGFARLGHPAIEARVDYAEVQLAAGLATDAGVLADVTARRLAAAGNHSVAAEAWLLGAQAARVAGDAPAASARAARAREAFTAQGATGGALAARLEEFRAGDHGTVRELVSLADELGTAGNAVGAVHALAVATTRAADGGDAIAAASLAARCEAAAGPVRVLEARLAAAHAAAVAALIAGDRPLARRRLRRGLDDLARHQGALGATDARAHVAVHGRELAALGLRQSLDGGAAMAFDWMERVRAGALRHPPARPPRDAESARLLAELRGVAADARQAELEGADSTDLRQRQAAIEAAVSRVERHRSGAGLGAVRRRAVRTSEIRAHLDQRVLVSLADVGGALYAVVVGQGRSRLVDLGPIEQVTSAGRTAAAAVRDLAVDPDRPGRLELLRAALAELDAFAIAPLRLDEPTVILVVPGPLHTAPWRSVPSLVERAVTLAPSATVWADLLGADRRADPTGAMLAVAGPRLREAAAEAAAVAACHEAATVLVGADASAAAVSAALPTAASAHFATHGHFRLDNPLWSSLELADGPLTVYDLERLDRTPPLVVLSACESGVSGVLAGDEFLGLTAALLRLGTRTLVAASGPLPDRPETRDLLVAFHRAVATGVDPAQALAAADPGLADGSPLGIAAAGLACFGLGLG